MRKQELTLPNVKIAVIPGKGRGVIACANFKKNELVEISPIIPISKEDEDMIYHTCLNQYLFTLGDTDKSALALGYGSLYNHSDKPNCWFITNGSVIKFFALKDIKKGTELTVSYGWEKEYTKNFK